MSYPAHSARELLVGSLGVDPYERIEQLRRAGERKARAEGVAYQMEHERQVVLAMVKNEIEQRERRAGKTSPSPSWTGSRARPTATANTWRARQQRSRSASKRPASTTRSVARCCGTRRRSRTSTRCRGWTTGGADEVDGFSPR